LPGLQSRLEIVGTKGLQEPRKSRSFHIPVHIQLTSGQLEGMIKDAEKTEKRDLNNDLEEWNRTLVSLTNLKGIEHSRHNITTKEIPALKATLEEKREEHQVLEEKAETVSGMHISFSR
jgi:hypothetical protein